MRLLISIFLILIFLIVNVYSQPKKYQERIITLKKVKLLEILDIESDKVGPLLNIVSKYDTEIIEKKEKTRDLALQLSQLNSKDKEFSKLNKELLQTQLDLLELQKNKLLKVKDLLDEENFAKFQIFEIKFVEEIRKKIYKMKK